MKKLNIKNLCMFIGLISPVFCLSQQAQTSSSPAANNGTGSNQFWSRAGNNNATGSNNLFGTKWNSPIYTQTNGINRMKLNGDFAYTINGYNQNRNGYMLLGQDGAFGSGGTVYGNRGAYSLLHLNGAGNGLQEGGYRSWMQTGITFTGNRDLSYFGLRKLSTNDEDFTETTLTWSDNVPGDDGADDFAIRFTSGDDNGTAATVSTNFNLSDDLDGLQEGDSASWKQKDLTLNV